MSQLMKSLSLKTISQMVINILPHQEAHNGPCNFLKCLGAKSKRFSTSSCIQLTSDKRGIYYTLLHFWGEWIHNAHNPRWRCVCMRVILLAYLFRISHFTSHWAKACSAAQLFLSAFLFSGRDASNDCFFLLVECDIWIVSASRGWLIHIFKVIWQQNCSLLFLWMTKQCENTSISALCL